MEVLNQGGLARLVNLPEEETSRQLFTRIWGVGSKTAVKLVQQGYRTFEDLRNAPKGTVRTTSVGVALQISYRCA